MPIPYNALSGLQEKSETVASAAFTPGGAWGCYVLAFQAEKEARRVRARRGGHPGFTGGTPVPPCPRQRRRGHAT